MRASNDVLTAQDGSVTHHGRAPRRHTGGAGGDDRDFDWMYGDRPARHRRRRTRRRPQQPAAARAPATAPSRPSAPGPAAAVRTAAAGRRTGGRRAAVPTAGQPPAERGRGGGRRSIWSRPRTWIVLVLSLILLWVVYVVAVPLFTWTKVDKIAFEPDGDRPDDQPGTTYLMVGSDSRAGLSEEERKKLSTGNPRAPSPTRS